MITGLFTGLGKAVDSLFGEALTPKEKYEAAKLNHNLEVHADKAVDTMNQTADREQARHQEQERSATQQRQRDDRER